MMLDVGKVGEVKSKQSLSGSDRGLNPVSSLQDACAFLEVPGHRPPPPPNAGVWGRRTGGGSAISDSLTPGRS